MKLIDKAAERIARKETAEILLRAQAGLREGLHFALCGPEPRAELMRIRARAIGMKPRSERADLRREVRLLSEFLQDAGRRERLLQLPLWAQARDVSRIASGLKPLLSAQPEPEGSEEEHAEEIAEGYGDDAAAEAYRRGYRDGRRALWPWPLSLLARRYAGYALAAALTLLLAGLWWWALRGGSIA